MTTEQPAQLDWFKSSYSGGEGGECVEVAAAPVRVRDSKEHGGPQLAFTRGTWPVFDAEAGRSQSN